MRRHGGTSAAPNAAPARLRVPRVQPLLPDVWRRRHRLVVAVLAFHAPLFPVILAIRDDGDRRWTWIRVAAAVGLSLGTAVAGRSRSRVVAEAVASFSIYVLSGMVVQQTGGLLEAQFHFILAMVVVSSYQSWTPWLVAVPFVPVEFFVRSAFDLPMVTDQLRWTVLHEVVAAAALGSWFSLTSVREDAERRIASLTLRYELIIQSAGEGIYGLDLEGRTTFLNAAAEAMLGWKADELQGRSQHASIHHTRPDGSQYPEDSCPINRALTTATVQRSSDDIFWRRDGTAFPVEYIATPIEQDGAIVGVVVTFSDITDRLRAEATREEVLRLQEAEAAQRAVLEQLQEALRPPTPALPGAAIGVCYLPADPTSPTGGDLYDLQVLPDGSLHIAVVDVLGKGVEATKDALAVTYVLRSLVLEGHPLTEIVARADALLSTQRADLVATVLVGRYHPGDGRLALAGGGHPPALLIPVQGEPTYVSAPGAPLGWPGAGSAGTVDIALDPGDTLLLYTDGLVEGNKDIVRGMDALAEAAAGLATLEPEPLASTLVQRTVAEAIRRDDTLALVLRRTHQPSAARVA